jgi:hypothetical protein
MAGIYLFLTVVTTEESEESGKFDFIDLHSKLHGSAEGALVVCSKLVSHVPLCMRLRKIVNVSQCILLLC